MFNFGFFIIGLPLFLFGLSEEAFILLPYWGRVACAIGGVYMVIYAIQHRK